MSRPLFREHLLDFVSQRMHLNFDELSDCERSKCMARFYAQEVTERLNPGLLPVTEEELSACVVDGTDDCGVDFLCRNSGTVLVIQAKYSSAKKRSKSPVEDPRHFEAFVSVLSRLYAGPKKLKMNAKLREALSDIDWERDNFHLVYITLRVPAGNATSVEQQGVTPISELRDLTERSVLELLNEESLNIALRDAMGLDEESTKPVSIRFSTDESGAPFLRFLDPSTGRESYVGRVNGSQLAEMYRAHRARLFALNIRNYIGDNATNKQIRKTAIKDPERFYFFNNGIAALATHFEMDPDDSEGRTLKCQQFSIINGAQTVRSLLKAQGEDPQAAKKVEVLIRITHFKSKKTVGEQEFLDSVTRYNNTQNAIRISDFRSNDRIQIDLARRFDALPARGGRKFVYKNKRSGEREANKIAITMEEFTKTIHAFLLGPDDVFGGAQYLFDTSKDGGYLKLFGDGGDLLPVLSDAQFKRYAGIWFLCEFARDVWRKETDSNSSEALERRWMVFYALGESIRLAYAKTGNDVQEALERLSDPNWYPSGSPERIKDVASRHCLNAFATLRNAYGKESKAVDFRHRNWFRSSLTLEAVKAEMEALWPILGQFSKDYLF